MSVNGHRRKNRKGDGPPRSGDGWQWSLGLLLAIQEHSWRSHQRQLEIDEVREFLDRHPDLRERLMREIAYDNDPETDRPLKAALWQSIHTEMEKEKIEADRLARERWRRLVALARHRDAHATAH